MVEKHIKVQFRREVTLKRAIEFNRLFKEIQIYTERIDKLIFYFENNKNSKQKRDQAYKLYEILVFRTYILKGRVFDICNFEKVISDIKQTITKK